MIEANEDIDLVTMRRQQELSRAKVSYQRDVSEGRLAVKPWQGAPSGGRAALDVAGHGDAGNAAVTSTAIPGNAAATSVAPPTETRPSADPEATWRHTRLAITAGLVVLLLVVWIWQKKRGR